MDINTLLQFISDNFTPLLTAISVLSFVLNIIQYKTNQNVQYHLDSIYQTCITVLHANGQKEWTKNEFTHAIYTIRIQSVSGLRSLGITRGYGSNDLITDQGLMYRFLENNYHTLMKVKEKWPTLFGKANKIDKE